MKERDTLLRMENLKMFSQLTVSFTSDPPLLLPIYAQPLQIQELKTVPNPQASLSKSLQGLES